MNSVGRPRLARRHSTGDPRQEILGAAADLFSSGGYTATSTGAIAEAVGLRQASLFYYYPSKEAILTELLDRTVRPTLALTRRLSEAELGPESTLWVLAERDVANLCSGSHNLGALQLLPEAHGEQFSWFWRRRHRLFEFYRRQVQLGTAAGRFPAGDLPSAPDLVFGLVESVITARPSVRRDRAVGANVADAALRLLGVPFAPLRQARRRGILFEEQDVGANHRSSPGEHFGNISVG
ncbi:MAG TPA: TetR/AcrR family transcriptional regulator [Acidimicrobiales bacterium]|jgi:AcrR family transcriptional regulator|nr:TetR/AcrR family transcriptional regulator [Acidimicrobiales bacterium]